MPIAQCQCGALTATVAGPSPATVACHCRACQRRTGSPFGVAAYFPADAVALIGEPRIYARATATGGTFTTRFCGTCGSSLWWTTAKHPGLIGIAVGAFADPDWPAPVRSVWEATRHAWVDVAAIAQHYPHGVG